MLVNIASLERGREHFTASGDFLQVLPSIKSPSYPERMAGLRFLRNCSFMWENEAFAKSVLSNDIKLVETLLRNVLDLLHFEKLAGGQEERVAECFKKYSGPGYQSVKSKEKSLAELEITLDVLLILSNANFSVLKPEFSHDLLRELIGILRFSSHLKEETVDKLDALEIFCLC